MGRTVGGRWWIALVVVVALAAGCSDDTTPASSTDDDNRATTTTTTRSVPSKYAGFTSDVYADDASWLCRPDTDDICDSGLDATVVAADGSTTIEPWTAATDPAFDCFYVYPTISRDLTPNSDMVASPDEEGYAAINQVARLGSECRVFAPIYRQVTLGALAARISGNAGAAGAEPDQEMAYADVLDAWKQYMAHDNDGRGVVLIGHSQGAGILTNLIAEEIDGDDEVQPLLISAYLAGTGLAVPDGKDVGGAFEDIALCRSETQTGCAIAWVSFRDTAPPPDDTFFGRVRGDNPDGFVAACVSPAALSGGSAELRSYFPASPSASILASLGASSGATGASWSKTGTVTTPFATVPGLTSGECTTTNGANHLSVHVNADPADARADDIGGDLTPQWGLHLVDVNLVMGDIVELVRSQAHAFLNG